MKFQFPFAKLLELRIRSEDVARKQFTEAQRAVDDANRELAEMYAAIDRSRLSSHDLALKGGADPARLVQNDVFVLGQATLIERKRLVIRDLMSVVEAAQAVLVEAAKERKTLEKLRERRLNEWKAALKKREIKQLDELATTRHGRLDRE